MPLSNLDELIHSLSSDQCSPQFILGTIKQGKEALFKAFDDGVPATTLIKQYAYFIDTVLSHCFNYHLSDKQLGQCSLVAVGGYGRLELLPGSDVDLLILLDGEPDGELEQSLSSFLTVLWDFGLEIGHSVRTIQDCLEQGKDDITVITNMIEARFITGSNALYDDFQQAIAPEHLWSSRDFFEAKLSELETRHAKFGNTAYNLEPDIKEGPGGLRDIQIIGWVAKRQFDANTLHDLVEHKFLTQEEYDTLFNGQELLLKIRFALHRLTKRREDRLLFEHQMELSTLFGYESGPNNLSIEQFMQTYYRNVMELERLSEMLLQIFKEEILFAAKDDAGVAINKRFIKRNGFIEVAHTDVFIDTPSALIEIFIILQQDDELNGIHASTIRLIREHLYLIDDQFRSTPSINSLFIRFMRNQKGVTHQLRLMNRHGVLAAYIPAFQQIVGRMQYDLYHAYTVDTHTLFVIRNMRRFSVPQFKSEFPLCSEIHDNLKKPELLYLSGLFHDIAKGRGGDHGELGARDAMQFCLQHQMSREDAKIVSNLVKLHLSMSMVAQKKDLSDPEEILEFAEQVGDSDLLDYLYLLTVSDIRGTNPKQWNNWKDSLLKELYHKTKSVLDNPDQIILSREKQAAENKKCAFQMLEEQHIDLVASKEFCNSLPNEYFLQYDTVEISWHVKSVINKQQETAVLIQQSERFKTTEIFIYTKANKHVIYRVATSLDNLGLTVLNARILMTSNDYTLDTFIIQESDGSSSLSQERIKQLENTLNENLLKETRVKRSAHNRIARQLKSFEIETSLEFTQDYPNNKTLLEITTNDRPGLLSLITQVLEQSDVFICDAKVSTLGEKVNDVFTITSQNNELINNETELNQLRDKLNENIATLY